MGDPIKGERVRTEDGENGKGGMLAKRDDVVGVANLRLGDEIHHGLLGPALGTITAYRQRVPRECKRNEPRILTACPGR